MSRLTPISRIVSPPRKDLIIEGVLCDQVDTFIIFKSFIEFDQARMIHFWEIADLAFEG